MTLGDRIASLRKEEGMTQETLAKHLCVTNQAISKWESNQCCPDVMLLPKIADLFEVSMDTLFGRAPSAPAQLPWEDDDTLRVVLFRGRGYLESRNICGNVEIAWNGPALNVQSSFSITCDEVGGDVRAGGDVTCDGVQGDVHAGGDVACDAVGGGVCAGGDVTCDDVAGHVQAGGDVVCDDVAGNVTAGCDVNHGHARGCGAKG